MPRLFKSSKFWLLILDTVIALLTIVLQQVLLPDKLEFALAIITIIQPVFIMVIKGITEEDVATKTYFGAAVRYSDFVGDDGMSDDTPK